MDFSTVCQSFNIHVDADLKAGCKKHDGKRKKDGCWDTAFQQQPKIKCKMSRVFQMPVQ